MVIRIFSGGVSRIAKVSAVAVAGVLTVLSVVALASRHGDHKEVSALIDRYCKTDEQQGAGDTAKDPKKGKSPQDEQVERIQKRNIFSPAKKKGFSAKLMGILGDSAIFAPSEFVKVGQSVSGAKVKEIGPDWVVVEYEGKPKKLFVFGSGGAPSGPSGPSMPPGSRGMPGGRVIVSSGRTPPAMPPGFKVTPEMIEQFKQLSPDQREKALSRMPPEVRAKLEKGM